ncbi:MAG: hypothetical protein JWM95_27 [Gemmatimonadetes bacterium]|nr:hypothetical protein [Gemmatimonadota bacterium]
MQKLRHLDLLLMRPWGVMVDVGTGTSRTTSAKVMIANPVSFIAQKLLIQTARKPDKQSQDILYIHDTLELFASNLDSLRPSGWTISFRR